jgi:hypothetical protein
MLSDIDYTRIMFGEHARQVPAWCYVQDQGSGVVSFVGSSRADSPHPLRFGSSRTHQFVVGELMLGNGEVLFASRS